MKRNSSRYFGRYLPQFDRLDERIVPAGNVTASVIDGRLFLTGDMEANQIRIVPGGVDGVSVSALDSDTTINDDAGPVVFNNVRGLEIKLHEGDDVLEVEGLRLKKGIMINAGDGADLVTLKNVKSRENGLMSGRDGDDTFNIIDTKFRQRLEMWFGAGDDQFNLSGSKFGRKSYFNGGEGDDTMGALDNDWGPRSEVVNFQSAIRAILPHAADDIGNVNEGGSAEIDVAGNDTTPAGELDLTSIVITQQPTRGTVTVNNDGTVTYQHNGSDTTTDSFQYTIKNNKNGTSNAATVDITITGVNDAPVATNDTATVAEGGTINIPVSTNDTDSDGTLDLTSIVITAQPANGTATVNTNGSVTYVHNGSETSSDTFSYTIKDNSGATSNVATVTITVTAANDVPVANPDPGTVTEGASVDINVAANDTDSDGTIDPTSIVITQQPANGTLTVNANGTVTYQHNGSETTSDEFRYTIEDNLGAISNAAIVTVTIVPVNDAPVANTDSAMVQPNGTVIIPVAANDTDVDGTIDPATIEITVQPANGTLTVNTDGTVTYQHNGSSTTSDSFQYTIRDNGGVVSNVATVNININASPVANPDPATVDEGGSVVINVASNDTDADGTLNLTSIVITQQPANGMLTVNADGTVSYQHNGSETTSDSFSYTINDDDGATSNAALVSITVTPQNDPPMAVADFFTLNQGDELILNLAMNDTDADGTIDPATIEITQQPTHGEITIHNDGTVTYKHDGAAVASDSFSYRIRDNLGMLSNEALVTLTITLMP